MEPVLILGLIVVVIICGFLLYNYFSSTSAPEEVVCDPETEYKSGTGLNAECLPFSECDPNTEYEAEAPTATSDRVCLPYEVECVEGVSYESAPRTATSDKECAPYQVECDPSNGEYEIAPRTAISDKECVVFADYCSNAECTSCLDDPDGNTYRVVEGNCIPNTLSTYVLCQDRDAWIGVNIYLNTGIYGIRSLTGVIEWNLKKCTLDTILTGSPVDSPWERNGGVIFRPPNMAVSTLPIIEMFAQNGVSDIARSCPSGTPVENCQVYPVEDHASYRFTIENPDLLDYSLQKEEIAVATIYFSKLQSDSTISDDFIKGLWIESAIDFENTERAGEMPFIYERKTEIEYGSPLEFEEAARVPIINDTNPLYPKFNLSDN